jgi:hypothetical protein
MKGVNMSSIPKTNGNNQITEYHASKRYKQIGEINEAIEKAVEKLGYDSGCGVDEFQPAEVEGKADQVGIWDVYIPCSIFDRNMLKGSSISIDKFAQHMKAETEKIRMAIRDCHPAIDSVEAANFWGIGDFHYMKNEDVEGDSAYTFNFKIKCSIEEIWKLMYPFERLEEAGIPGPRVELAGYLNPGECEPTVLWALRLAKAVIEDARKTSFYWNYKPEDSFVLPKVQNARQYLIDTKGICLEEYSTEEDFSGLGSVGDCLIDSIDYEMKMLFNMGE